MGVNDGRAVTLAKRARSVDPFALDPLYQAAAAEVDRGARIRRAHEKGWLANYRAANERAYGYYTKATQVQPQNAEAWYQLGEFDRHAQLPARGAAAVRPLHGAQPAGTRPGTRNTTKALGRVNSGNAGLLAVGPRARYAPTITTSWPPLSATARSPSSGPTTFTLRSFASRRALGAEAGAVHHDRRRVVLAARVLRAGDRVAEELEPRGLGRPRPGGRCR